MKTSVASTLRGALCVLIVVSAITVIKADEAKKKTEEQAKLLEKWDANKNGKLDPDEVAAMKAAKKETVEKKQAEDKVAVKDNPDSSVTEAK